MPTLPEKETRQLRIETFAELDLSRPLLKGLEKAGYKKPTPVQAGLIPFALDDLDVIGQARTGTGKTAAFSIPILDRLTYRSPRPILQALILVPTRELSVQVQREIDKLGNEMGVKTVAVYGGKPIRSQTSKLQEGVHIVVGTPGRVIDHLERGTLKTQDIWCVVLDEADAMLDIGFRPAIEKILRRCPEDRQTLLLSATVPNEIKRLAHRYMIEPKLLNFSPSKISASTIEQYYFTVRREDKLQLLLKLIEREDPKQAIIFCKTKVDTHRLYRVLSQKMDKVGSIHGNLSQSERDKTMRALREGNMRFLVATDVVGRGIDVSSISHIFNYDIPELSDDYVHRVGRTGRMGRDGIAYTFVMPGQTHLLTSIEKRIDRLLESLPVTSVDPTLVELVGDRAPEKPPVKKRYRSAL